MVVQEKEVFMKRYALKKDVLVQEVNNDNNHKKVVKLKKGTKYFYNVRGNAGKRIILLCRRYKEVTDTKIQCYDCIKLPREELTKYFTELPDEKVMKKKDGEKKPTTLYEDVLTELEMIERKIQNEI